MIADAQLDGLAAAATFLVGLGLGVVVHELGHFLAAHWLGLGPRILSIGEGRVLVRRRFGGVWMILRAIPFTGYVLAPNWVGRDWAHAVFIAAGPGINLLLLAAAGLVAVSAGSDAVQSSAAAFAVAQAVIALITLTPQTLDAARGRRSDGLQLLRLATGRRRPSIEEVHGALMRPLLAPGAAVPAPSRYGVEIAFQIGRRDRFEEAWACRDAQDAMRALLDKGDMPREERALVLCFLVGNELYFGETDTGSADLDAWSSRALELAPVPSTRVLRGGTLVATDRAAEGRAVLLGVLDEDLTDGDPVFARALLGVAEASLGNPAACDQRFAEARACPAARTELVHCILDRLEAAARAATPQPPVSGVPRVPRRSVQRAP